LYDEIELTSTETQTDMSLANTVTFPAFGSDHSSIVQSFASGLRQLNGSQSHIEIRDIGAVSDDGNNDGGGGSCSSSCTFGSAGDGDILEVHSVSNARDYSDDSNDEGLSHDHTSTQYTQELSDHHATDSAGNGIQTDRDEKNDADSGDDGSDDDNDSSADNHDVMSILRSVLCLIDERIAKEIRQCHVYETYGPSLKCDLSGLLQFHGDRVSRLRNFREAVQLEHATGNFDPIDVHARMRSEFW
jgi:hypothetical protein